MRESEIYETSGNGGGFVMGLIAGAAVGAALGLMFAPKRGSELRDDLAKSTEGMRRRASQAYDAVSDTVSDLASKGGSVVSNMLNKSEDLVEQGQKAVEVGRDVVDQTRSAVNSMRRRAESAT
jgi:gas vesicle protein